LHSKPDSVNLAAVRKFRVVLNITVKKTCTMNTSNMRPQSNYRSRQATAIFCAWALLLASAHLAPAQFSATAGTNAYNYSDYNATPAATDGLQVQAPYTGTPLPYPGVPSVSPGPTISTSDPNFAATITGASASASGNIGGGATPYGSGITVTLDNPNPGDAAEVRLDWFSTFTYTGGPFSPTGITAIIMGNTLGYYAVAGGEVIDDNGNLSTATLAGNGFSPAPLNPSATWFGAVNSGPIITSDSGSFTPLTINNGDTIEVQGFLDLVVDPGSVQVELETTPEPGTVALVLSGTVGLFLGIRKFRGSATA
jgi:hypothetical protein